MHVNSILIVMLLMVSIIATFVKAENQVDKYPEKNISKKITKRESSVLIDNYPLDTIINKKEQLYVKRISQPRGPNSDSRYFRPLKRPTHRKFSKPNKKKLNRIPTGAWSPYKSNKRPYYSYKQGSARRRPLKSDYESRFQQQNKLKSKRKKVNKTRQHVYNSLKPVGFGEPPLDFLSHYEPPEAEPMDSYGEAHDAPASRKPYPLDAALFNDDMPPRPPPHNDNKFAFSNTHSKVIVPDVNAFDNPLLLDFSDNSVGGLYPGVFKREKNNKMFQLNRRRPTADIGDELQKFHMKEERKRDRRYKDEHEIVGGQYAEPPARFVTKPQQNEQFDDDDEFSPSILVNTKFNSKYASSANISPYVNYKNGNIAFSPQNLNDAFSIIDK